MKPIAKSRTVLGGILGIAVVWAIRKGWLPLEEKDAQALTDAMEMLLLVLLRLGVRSDAKAVKDG